MTTCPTNTRSCVHDTGLFLIRAIVGVVLMYHGSQKLFGWFGGPGMSAETGFVASITKMGLPYPVLSAWLAACTEFVGGVLLILGLAVRLIAIPMAFNMYVAAFMVHGKAFSLQHGGMEYALTLAVVLTGLILTGGGGCSLPGLLARQGTANSGNLADRPGEMPRTPPERT